MSEPDVDVRDALVAAAVADEYSPELAAAFADIAYRRWNSFHRRHRKRADFSDRVLDLARGLRERSPVDPIYMAPGDYKRLAERLAAVLDGASTA